jgi:hypothetical protein
VQFGRFERNSVFDRENRFQNKIFFNLLIFRQRVLTDQLHNLHEIGLNLENLREALLKRSIFRRVFSEERLEGLDVLGERDVPVDGREMLTLGKLLVQTPENLHDGERGRSDGICEITTGRGHGADDGDSANTGGGSEAFGAAGTLVERSKTSSQISWVTAIGGHFCQTTGDFTKGLGPTGGGVGHHRNVLTLVTEVLGDGDTGVNRSLTSGHGHVGSVGNQGGTLHNTFFLSVNLGHQLWEFHKYLSHFVTTLTATDVSDNIGVGELGQRLGNDGLAATEGTGDGASATLAGGEEGVEDALAGKHRTDTGELVAGGAGLTHWPILLHGHVVGGSVGQRDLGDRVGHDVGAAGDDGRQSAGDVRGNHDTVVLEKLGLVDLADHIAADDVVADTDGGGGELPTLVAVKAGDFDTAGDVDVGAELVNVLEGTLDTVKNSVQNTGAEFEGEGLAGLDNGIANGHTCYFFQIERKFSFEIGKFASKLKFERVNLKHTRGVLVNLDGGGVLFQANDLAYKAFLTDTDNFVHTGSAHTLGHDQRSGNFDNASIRHCEKKSLSLLPLVENARVLLACCINLLLDDSIMIDEAKIRFEFKRNARIVPMN